MTPTQKLVKQSRYFWTAEAWIHLIVFCFFVFLTTVFDLDKPNTDYLMVKVVCMEVIIGFISFILMDEEMQREAAK